MTAELFLLSILGSVSGYQILANLRMLRVISPPTSHRMRVLIVPACLCVFFLTSENVFLTLFLILSLHLIPFLLMIWNQTARRSRFRREILPFLDELVLKMKMGRSFRESLSEISGQGLYAKNTDFAELSTLICFPSEPSKAQLIRESRDLLEEFRKVDQSSARAIEKIAAYRRKQKIIKKFRQKSGQITGQIRAQALVCSILYGGLLIWVLITGRAALFSFVVILSMSLFLCGLATLALVQRSFRWKL